MNDEPRREPMTDGERARAALAQLRSVHAFDLAYEMMIGLVSFGYQKMGLTDETRALRHLDDARLAIELLRASLEVIEREQGRERTRDLHSTLAQMQLNYARAVQLAGAQVPQREGKDETAPEPAAPEPAAPAGEAARDQAPEEPAADAGPHGEERRSRRAAARAARRRPAERAAGRPVRRRRAPRSALPRAAHRARRR